MHTQEDKSTAASKQNDRAEELKTEGPISEKDEVKAAERKTANLNSKAGRPPKTKK